MDIMILSICLFIIGFVVLLFGLKEKKESKAFLQEAQKTYNEAENIKIIKNFQIEQSEKEALSLQEQINKLQKIKESLKLEIQNLYTQQDITLKQLKEQYQEQRNSFEEISLAAADQYMIVLDQSYNEAEAAFKTKIEALKKEEENIEQEIQKIKNFLSAGIRARLREEEKKNNMSFYMINLSKNDIEDILTLNQMKINFHNPVILSKLEWTTYIQKPAKELCSRVLNTNTVTGIYKITNIETEQVYIGQAVDVAKRWTDHIKCGLGIDTPSTIRLYKDMKEYNVWNYTFELLESCTREELNEKEKKWIEMYQSNIYGLNTQGGNK